MITEANADEVLAVHREALALVRSIAGRNWDTATVILDGADTRELAKVLAMMLVRELKPLFGDSVHQLLDGLERYQTHALAMEDEMRAALLA